MIIDDFDFQINEQSIAYYPEQQREKSRLMQVLGTGEIVHHTFSNLPTMLQAGDCLVLNDTKVMPARLYANKLTGGKIEILVEQVLSSDRALCRIGSNKSLLDGQEIIIGSEEGRLLHRQKDSWLVQLLDTSWQILMRDQGHMPLPPYIKRKDTDQDKLRYQTVYAKHEGAIAAPTAGLHFSDELLEQVAAMGVRIARLTLHIGFGTFSPVRVKDINQHKMHSENFVVSEESAQIINDCKSEGGRIIAVGTTSLRTLESVAHHGRMEAKQGSTDIFIRPGYQFKITDALITNFHLPKSTLLMLVSAFSGQDNIFNAYQVAQQEGYRFFSYGDAMFLQHTKETSL